MDGVCACVIESAILKYVFQIDYLFWKKGHQENLSVEYNNTDCQ